MRKWDIAPPTGGSARFGREWDGHLLIERIWPGAQVEYIVAEALEWRVSRRFRGRRDRAPSCRSGGLVAAVGGPNTTGHGLLQSRAPGRSGRPSASQLAPGGPDAAPASLPR